MSRKLMSESVHIPASVNASEHTSIRDQTMEEEREEHSSLAKAQDANDNVADLTIEIKERSF